MDKKSEMGELLEKSLVTIEKLHAELKEQHSLRNEPIAIVGMACHFPGESDNLEQYWKIIHEGRNTVGDLPKARWKVPKNAAYVAKGNFLNRNLEEFDAKFFKISPAEAREMDPQQRLLLETSWEALENAGIDPDKLIGSKTAVFIGISSNNEYSRLPQDKEKINQYAGTGVSSSIASGRISYIFGFNGPAISIDTACSSSLVSVYSAMQSLRNKDCDMALVGGVSLMISQDVMQTLGLMNALSKDGSCHPFDKNASGYGRGEGCGIIVLKRLSDALKDKDNIVAKIDGGAINNDGESSGLTVPNGKAQTEVMQNALKNCKLNPCDIDYIEAHGTGTPLGDPIEIDSICKAYLNRREVEFNSPISIGSVKGNIGHLECAAGIASIIKVALCLYKKEIPPIANFSELNPRIPDLNNKLSFPKNFHNWETLDGRIRRAAISSFGFSGTNVHLIMSEVEDEENEEEEQEDDLYNIIELSAKEEKSLVDMINHYITYLKDSRESIKKICFTANTCRSTFMHRAILIGKDKNDLIDSLNKMALAYEKNGTLYTNTTQLLGSTQDSDKWAGKRKIFTELDNQRGYCAYVDDMIKPKYAYIFNSKWSADLELQIQSLSKISRVFASKFEFCITKLKEGTNEITDAERLFAAEYAYIELMKVFNIYPEIVCGNNVANFIAAFAAGSINIEQAIKLFLYCKNNKKKDYNDTYLYIVSEAPVTHNNGWGEEAINVRTVLEISDKEIIVTGSEKDITNLITHGDGESFKCYPVDNNLLFGDGVDIEDYDRRESDMSNPLYRYYSMSRLENLPDIDSISDNFKSFLSKTQYYEKSIEGIYRQGYRFFIEFGESWNAKQIEIKKKKDMVWIPILRSANSGLELLQMLAKMACLGSNILWKELYDQTCKRCWLPNYPFVKAQYWVAPPKKSLVEFSMEDGNVFGALAGTEINLPVEEKFWRLKLSHDLLPELADNSGVLHIGYFLEIIKKYLIDSRKTEKISVKRITFHAPLIVYNGEEKDVLLSFDAKNDNTFCIHSKMVDQKIWNLNIDGRIEISREEDGDYFDFEQYKELANIHYTSNDFYFPLENDRGFYFGKTVRWIDEVWRKEDSVLVHFRYPEQNEKEKFALNLHPGILDSCAQACNFLALNHSSGRQKYMVIEMESISFQSKENSGELYALINLKEFNSNMRRIYADICVMNAIGERMISVKSICLKEFSEEQLGNINEAMKAKVMSKNGVDREFLYKYMQTPEKRRNILLEQYLIKLLAAVLETDPESIESTELVADLGLDSMNGVQLYNKIIENLGVSISYSELLQSTTVHDMVDYVKEFMPGGDRTENEDEMKLENYDIDLSPKHWIYNYMKLEKAKVRLYCFPNGYRNADMFDGWRNKLGPEIEVCPIMLPGMDSNRMKEKSPDDIETFTKTLEKVIVPEMTDLPCASFGHSWGSLFAYRLANRLGKNKNVDFVKLFVSGFTTPELPNSSVVKVLKELKLQGFEHIPQYEEIQNDINSIDAVVRAYVKAWGYEEEITRATLKFLLAACRIIEKYHYDKKELFEIPIVGFHGIDDFAVPIDEMKAWGNITTNSFRLYTMPGDHQFITGGQSEERLLQLIKDELKYLF